MDARPLPFPMVFRAPWWLATLALLGSVASGLLTVLCWWLVIANPQRMPAQLTVIFVLIALLMVVPMYACADVAYASTTVDRTGITLKRLLRRPRFIPIEDIRCFAIASIGSEETEAFRAQIYLKQSRRGIPFAGVDLRTYGWKKTWLGDTVERLNEWLLHQRR